MNSIHIKKWVKHGAIFALWALPMAVLAEDTLGTSYVETGLAGALGTKDIRTTIAQIINVALGLLGIVAVVIILAGGFTWMTAAGNEENVEKAKKMIFAGIIGLAIILSAYAIAKFVIDSLVTATTGP